MAEQVEQTGIYSDVFLAAANRIVREVDDRFCVGKMEREKGQASFRGDGQVLFTIACTNLLGQTESYAVVISNHDVLCSELYLLVLERLIAGANDFKRLIANGAYFGVKP